MFTKLKEFFVGPSKVRMGRPANETDTYMQNREIRMRAEIAQTKQEFHDLVGPIHEQTPLAIKRSGHSPNPSSASLTPSRTPEPPATAGPSGATTSPPADTQPRPQLLTVPGSVPVHSLSDVKATLRSVIGIIPTSTLQDEMKDLYGCCLVLITLLEKSDPSVEEAPHYTYIFSKMQQDLNDITQFLNEWMKKKTAVQHMQRKDIHIQVRSLEDIFTRHLNVFIALSQSESTTTMNKEFAELQTQMGIIQTHVRGGGSSDSRNTEQVEPEILRDQVRRITGYAPNAEWILTGKISYREAVTVSQGRTFDVYKGRLNDGETVAIKLLRQKLKNDGTGVRFVERIMRQVQLWSSFSSPFILECRGIGMQMTASEEEDYDRFQFYLVSPFIKRGDAVHYIRKLRREGAYVDILKYLRDAARGIQYLHQRNCVHASIRGENVLIKDDGTACLNGFGLTKAFTVGKLIELTGDNRQYHWMAPELLGQDKPPLYPSCDIWAWAMTALELITGKQPYYNVVQWDLLDHVVKQGKRPQREDYPAFNEQNCPQPDLMWDLLHKCWTEASERYTIEQVIEGLENIEKVQIEQQTTHVWT
ncbi:unnamed protein product [Rhizoctonia solani]|uniref:Protein kinase domain-containing protein n=1 Tax=Rhizoctonia solani TaxID=456999 RepID=A0A8H3HA83_9AGAM|nr:unnamed protein product [Rhizoctonia solani]